MIDILKNLWEKIMKRDIMVKKRISKEISKLWKRTKWEMKKYLNGISGSLDTTENKDNELKNRSREISQRDIQRRKKD